MYKLYISRGSCSLAPHIVIKEMKLPHSIIRVNTKTNICDDGSNYLDVNPNGWVPILQTANGHIISEVGVILQYLAEQKPELGLFPKCDQLSNIVKVRTQEWLSFISTELHKNFSPIFRDNLEENTKAVYRQKLKLRFAYVNKNIKGDFLQGQSFTIADAYLFVVTRWAMPMGIDISEYNRLMSFLSTMRSMPSVIEAMTIEKLSK